MKSWEVMKAHEEGAIIEFKGIGQNVSKWDRINVPQWDWSTYEYRIAPKKWQPNEGDIVENVSNGEVWRVRKVYKGDSWDGTIPYIQDIQFIDRDPTDETPPDWKGQYLLKHKNGRITISNSRISLHWEHINSDDDIMGWCPLGPIEEVRKVFFKHMRVEE